MTWDRALVAGALVAVLEPAVDPVVVHEAPPMTLNSPCVVIMRPTNVDYATAMLGIDDAELPVAVVSGVEQEDAIDAIKNQCRKAIDADPTLGGAVHSAVAASERGWRNVTGAGGVQLLLVELVIRVRT